MAVQHGSGSGHFDADAAVAALERPRLTVGRFTYTGLLLSFEEWAPHASRFNALRADPESSDSAWLAAARDYVGAIFPLSWWQRWIRRRPDPVRAYLALPPGVQLDLVLHFLALQVAATLPAAKRAAAMEAFRRPTSGTGSPS